MWSRTSCGTLAAFSKDSNVVKVWNVYSNAEESKAAEDDVSLSSSRNLDAGIPNETPKASNELETQPPILWNASQGSNHPLQ